MRAISSGALGISLGVLVAGCAGGAEPTAEELNASMPAASSTGEPQDTSGLSTPGGPPPSSPVASGVAPTPQDTPEPVAGDPAQPPASPQPSDTASPLIPGPGDTTTPEPDMDMPMGPVGTGGQAVVPEGTGGATPAPVTDPVPAGGMGANPGPVDTSMPEPVAPPEPVVVPEPVVPACEGPYCPRTGSFKMLAYSKTAGFPHTESINTGKIMLQEIADEQGFEVTFTASNEEITPEGLAQYEIVFFLNSTGDVFSNEEQATYEEWMGQNGAFAGVHSATDTENGWAFYSEVTGQYYDLHENCCVEANIQWDEGALDFIAVQGLPSPWRRSEEWYYFNKNAEWSTKAGFKILGRVTSSNNTRPVSYIREWGNFRSFYTSLGHQGSAFEDDYVKQHVAAGIMWAVRREAELQ